MNIKNLIYLFIAIICFACKADHPASNSEEVTTGDSQSEKTTETEQSESDLPETKTVTIGIEGMNEEQKLLLYDQRDGHFPLKFHTYYPDNFDVETVSSGEGDAIIFSMNEAKTFLSFPRERSVNSLEELDSLAKQMLEQSGAVDINKQHGVWNGHTDDILMNIDPQEHNGVFYYWFTQYPYEYGDGYPPRYSLILQEFVSAD